MGNIWKRSLSMFLALAMVFSMLPLNVFATETDGTDNSATTETTQAPTEAPTTEAPATTAAPTTEAPATEAPATEAPATTEAPAVDEAVAEVQAMIDALPTEVNSDEHAERVEKALAEIDEIVEDDAFPADAYQALDWAKIAAAYDAVDAWYGEDHSQDALATTSDPYWDETATAPYIIHVNANEADDITQEQLFDLLMEKWEDDTVFGGMLDAYGGFKCNNIELTNRNLWTNSSTAAGLENGKTYEVYVATELTKSWGVTNGQVWATTPIATFKVVEPEVTDTITLKPGPYTININTATYDGLREAIINAAVASVTDGEAGPVDNNLVTVKFHNIEDGLFFDDDQGWVELGADESAYTASIADDKTTFKISYNTAAEQTVTVTFTDNRQPAVITMTDEDQVFYADTYAKFEAAVKAAVKITDNNNADISNESKYSGLSITYLKSVTITPVTEGAAFPTTLDGATQYTVTCNTAYEGDSWVNAVETTFTVTAKVNGYTVTWKNTDGSVLDTDTVAYGGTPAYTGETPTQAATAQYTYTHAGWTPAIGTVTGDVTYTATYTSTVNTYNIHWDTDGDGDVDQTTENVEYGATLTAPDYTDKSESDLTFVGWKSSVDNETYTDDTEIPTVSGEVTYTAQYSADKVYTIKFYVDGVQLGETQLVNVDDNETVTFPENPDKANAIFTGWTNENLIVNGTPTGDNLEIRLDAQWNTNDANDNDVDDDDETAYVQVKITGNGTVTLSGTAQITDNGNDNYTVLYNSNDTATQTVTVTATPGTTGAANSAVYVVSAPATVTVADGETTTVDVKFAVETFTLPENADGYEIKINGFSNETKAVNLKTLVLDEIFGADNYNAADYKVEMLTSYSMGSYTLENYYNVEGAVLDFTWIPIIGTTVELPASWFVTQLVVDGETENNFKITKLAASNESNVDLYHEDVMIVAGEERETTDNITLSDTDYTEDTLADVIDAIKGNVLVNGASANVTVTLTPETALSREKQTYTASVTAPATAGYLESSKEFTITADINVYTITWNVDGVTTDVDYTYGETIVAPADPEKEGHTFAGWTGWTEGTTASADVTYTATYTVNSYTVTWTVNGEDYGTPSTFEYGSAVTAPEYTTPEGYTFSGWTVPETMPAEDITLNATLTVNNYDVVWVWQNTEGEQTTTQTLPYGTAIVVPAEIPAQYTVGNETFTRTGWTGLTDGATVPVDGITYTATYTSATAWIVDFDSNSGSEVIDQTVIVPEGETGYATEPTAPTRDGYRFLGWYTEDDELYDFSTPITADIKLTAKWVKQVTVTFEGAEIDSQTFDINGTATKPTDPDEEYAIFGGWYTEDGAEYDFSAPVNEDITLTAKWIEDTNDNNVLDENETVTVTVTAGEAGGTVTINGENVTSYVYDSVKGETITIKAEPTIVEGSSASYVSSIVVNGEEIELVYADDYSVSYDMVINSSEAATVAETASDIVVTFTDCGFEYDEDGEMRFYVGMETPDKEMLYNSVITAPAYDENVQSVEYLARPAGTYSITVPVLFEYTIPYINYTIKIGGTTYDVDLEDAWLDVGEEFKTLTPEQLQAQYDTEIKKIQDKIAAIDLSDLNWSNAWDKVQQFTAISEELTTLMNTIITEAQYLGYHQFGANGTVDENGNVQEILKVVYDNGAMHLEDSTVVVTLVDDRTATTITGGDLTFEYDEYDDSTIMDAITLVDDKGNIIDGELHKYTVLADKNVGEYTYTVYFDGNYDYKPSSAEFTLTVIKAPSSVDVPNVNITYGESYNGAPVITNKHGAVINIDSFRFLIGLDIAELDIDGDGVKGLSGKVQLMVPEDLQTILAAVGLGDGVEMTLSQLVEFLNNNLSMLEQWGLTQEIVDVINQIMDEIQGIVETADLMITIGGSYPTDIGAYLHGAVTVDGNYETSYDVGYILIRPDASRVYLNWNHNDTNGVYTPELLQHVNLGASAFDDAEFVTLNDAASKQVNNLFFGIDINGNLVADLYNTDVDPEAIETELDNGAYTQMAFIAEFGNEFYYAVPIVRAFAIVPNTVEVEIVVDGAEVADLYTTTFDNEPVDVEAIVTYTQGAEIPGEGEVTYQYYGIKTNTNTYDSDVAPTNAGAYIVTATYTAYDETGKMVALGMDVATLIIKPTESTITVDDEIVDFVSGNKYYFSEQITVGSTVAGLEPDTTIISAGINTDGDFSENGWEAVGGNINVDFPKWVDELIAEYAPSVVDGITVKEFSEKLVGKLPDITAELAELGVTKEIINSLTNAVNNVADVLADVPENVTLSFQDDAYAKSVGAYVVVAVVTDSDHIPAVDAGLLVIVPNTTIVELKWNYEDENGIWTRELLKYVDLNAKAFDYETGAYDEAATEKITYQFIGIDKNFDLIVSNAENSDELPNGAYIELAYIELEVDGAMTLSNLIARELLIVPGTAEVTFVDVNNNNARHFTFDNTPKAMDVVVTINGTEITPAEGDLTVTYIGVQTNTKTYNSTTAPTQAGVYTVIAEYRENTTAGSMANIGGAIGIMAIEPAESTIDVTGGTVTYDGEGHTATVVATGNGVTEPDYTLISGGAYVSGDIDEIGVDAFHGNVNIDFPEWLDAYLAETEFATEGVDTAYLIDFIGSYRDDLIALIPVDELVALGVAEDEINATIDKLNGYIDELLAVLDKLPKDVALTFEDDVTYTEPGAYGFVGIVTDSDHYPSTDTGLLVIEKMDMPFNLVDTTATWNGEGHMVNVSNPKNADYATVIIDRANNTINILIDEDAQYLINTVARILDVEFDGDVQMSTIIEKYDGKELAAAIVELISELEKQDLSEEILKALAAVKAELETLPESGTITVNGALPAEVGEYEVYAISYSQYYKTVSSESVLEIVPVQVEVVLDNITKVYGETDPKLTYTVYYYDHEGNELADAGIATVVVDRVDGDDVGEYAITAEVTLTDDMHYELIAQPEAAVFTITPAKLTVTVDDKTKTYGDADPDFTYTITEGALVDDDTLSVAYSRATDNEDVGTYENEINATVTQNGNYEIEVVPGTLTITAKEITEADISVDLDELTYNGTAQNHNVVLLNGITADITGETTGTNAGKYTVTVTGTGNYTGTVENVKWTINKKAATVTANDKSMVAGNAIPELDATVDGAVDGETLSYTLSTNTDGKTAGTYDIVVTLAENPNYDVTVINGTLTVETCIATVDGVAFSDWEEAKAAIKGDSVIVLYADIVNDKFSYGEANKTFTLDLNGHNFTTENIGMDGHKTLHIIDSAEGGSVTVTDYVGLYANGYLNVDSDVDFNGTLQINYHSAGSTGCFMVDGVKWIGRGHFALEDGIIGTTGAYVRITNGFMNIEFTSGKFTLNESIETLAGQSITIGKKATLTIPADVILTIDPASTIVVNGTVDGEGTIVVGNGEHLETILKTAVANIVLSDNASGDFVSENAHTLDLNGKTLTGNLAVNGNLTIVDSTVKDNTVESFLAAGSVTGDVTVDGALILNAGNYSADMDAYCAEGLVTIKTAEGVYTVMVPQPFEAKLNDETHIYDGNEQTQGFVVKDAFDNVLVEGVDFDVTGHKQINAGTHTITITGKGDYTGTVTLTWTIDAKQITEADVALDGTLTYNGQEQDHNVVLLNGITADITGATTGTNAGEYTVTVTGTGNYTGTVENVKWTIAKKAAIITANDKSMVAGNAIPELDATVDGAVDGETLNYTVTTDYVSEIGKHGEFVIKVTAGENPNYDVTVVNGKLTVLECVLTVDGVAYSSWEDAMKDNSSSEKEYILKDAKIKLYADISYETKVQHRFNGNMEIDLNGYDLYVQFAVTANGTMTITGNGTFDAGSDGWPMYVVGKVVLDPSVTFDGMLQFNKGSTGNLVIGDEYALGNTGKYNTAGSDAYVRIVFNQGLKEIDLQSGHITLTKNDGTLDEQIITIGQNSTFTIAEGVTLTLDPTTTVTIKGTVDGAGTIVVNSAEHLNQVLAETTVANIKLGSDITNDTVVERDVTLDLNGKTLTGDVTVNSGKLIVKDSKVDETKKNYVDAGYVTGNVTVGAELYAGTYNFDVTELCAEGYIAVPNAKTEGTWTVMKGILTVDNVPYDSWAEALDDIENGADMIVLYGNVSFRENETAAFTMSIKTYDDVTIDLNGFNLALKSTIRLPSGATLNVIDSSEKSTGSLTMLKNGWGITLSSNDSFKLDSDVEFIGTLQINNVKNGAKNYFYIGDDLIIGENGMFEAIADTNYVTLHLKNGIMELDLESGHLQMNKTEMTTLAGQKITIRTNAKLTIPADKTLILDPTSEIKVNGTVDGEGTVVVSTIEHLNTVLATEVANVKLGDNVTGDAVADNTHTLDLNQKTVDGTLTVNGNLTIMDSSVDIGSTPEEFKAAGKVVKDLTVADGATLTLYAGTYNSNVAKYCANGYGAFDNQNGTWTVMSGVVAYNVQTGISYFDVSDALAVTASGETLKLLVDTETEAMIMVPAGVTFDLNGHYITAYNVLSFGNVIDSTDADENKGWYVEADDTTLVDGLGGIKITNDRTQAFVQMQKSNKYMPLYDVNEGCYRFYNYQFSILSYKAYTDAITFRYRLRLSSAYAYQLLADTQNSGVNIMVDLNWTGLPSNIIYTMSDDIVAEYGNAAYEQVASGEKTAMTVNKTLELTVTGLNHLESGVVMTANPMFHSETGMHYADTREIDKYTVHTIP